jgi:putative ATPase
MGPGKLSTSLDMNEKIDIFEYSLKEQLKQDAPLADRMRPATLDQFVGQDHILAPGRLLRRAIQADQLSSLIFFGPPGTGKTTLARIIANTTKAQFISLNAVLSGVKDIRAGIQSAEQFRMEYTRKTILFIDEVHRFNKAQQDALLPHVENGIVILIGATTENPYFEVNKALVSRSRIFQLESLQEHNLEMILDIVLQDEERGYGKRAVHIDLSARKHLVNVANGDARALLNALELAVETSELREDDSIHIDLTIAEESIQKKAVLYDKDGDAHFDTISAFIKSLRGSDPDAALYWMAKMVYGGEDPRFLFRRMIVFAGEDVGLADPQALQVVMSAAQAFDYVGMPEGRFHLAQACLYLATAPKSNSGFAFFDALDTVAKEKHGGVPNHIKDANRDQEGFGHGKGYLYPHAYRDHWVAQQYLPDLLQGRLFYQPSDQGYEAKVKVDVLRRRELQLAAILHSRGDQNGDDEEYWLGRTLGNTVELLATIRDYCFSKIQFEPYQMILILNAGDGVMLGETLRKAVEATVYSLVRDDDEKSFLDSRFADMDPLFKPLISVAGNQSSDLSKFEEFEREGVQFDLIFGMGFLDKKDSNRKVLNKLNGLMSPKGCLILVESIPVHSQKLSAFIPEGNLADDLEKRLLGVEKKIYDQKPGETRIWDQTAVVEELESSGFFIDKVRTSEFFYKTMISEKKIREWFTPGAGENKTYVDYLGIDLTGEEIERIRDLLLNQLSGKVVNWSSSWMFVKAVKRL